MAILLVTVFKPRKRADRRFIARPIDRPGHARRAVELFNAGSYWEAHEELERIWRSLRDDAEAEVIQGLIQAAAALLHQARGNQHGVDVIGSAGLHKLAGPQHPAVEFETEAFRHDLEKALKHGGPPPILRLR